ncbi:superfamily II DNA/RNA helicase [Maritalea mobilis]|uniref:DEAD-box ATP-dependent RNA helicase RhpA n=1 Tax=Maritalea mobilis TaxID=483324 RepID=A0A4R6VR00_9HYPH|nr:DEAD/DEAH box helicase [Maritalea mobilis]TDQ66412.1 superfamily II DNA/RNA helicase [Maritalea mobilis]
MSEHFSKLGLSQSVVNAVSDAGYSQPTDIQQKAIPHILEKRDIVGIAQTGTGKTASFVLPMLTLLEKGRARARMPRTLILEPTRELAAQVHENFEKYGKNHKLTVALLIGGVSFEEQNKKLDRGADVLIATPGRLLDHFERGRLLMTGVDIFVIDEADRMLDMGFVPDIERISALLPKRRQTLLFSATMPDEIAKLTHKFLTNPERVEVARQNSTAETITQKAIKVGSKPFEKRAALRAQINAAKELNNAIIFCNRKRDIATLTRSLERHGFNAGALHGDMDQKSRMATLDGFKAGTIKILVASDVAARGLDIPEVSHVYNFDVPTHAEDYVHRIGRTGRAGRTGEAVSLVTKADEKYLSAIEKLIEKTIPIENFEQEESAQSNSDKSKSEKPRRNRGQKKQAAENAEKNQKSASTESEKPSKNNRKKRSGNDNQDRVPFGQSDQVPAFLLRPVRRAS